MLFCLATLLLCRHFALCQLCADTAVHFDAVDDIVLVQLISAEVIQAGDLIPRIAATHPARSRRPVRIKPKKRLDAERKNRAIKSAFSPSSGTAAILGLAMACL
jgi:hypothetical protein